MEVYISLSLSFVCFHLGYWGAPGKSQEDEGVPYSEKDFKAPYREASDPSSYSDEAMSADTAQGSSTYGATGISEEAPNVDDDGDEQMREGKEEPAEPLKGTVAKRITVIQKNPVMRLNELNSGVLYNYVNESGPDNVKQYVMSVDIGHATFEGMGRSKKLAKADAAAKALLHVYSIACMAYEHGPGGKGKSLNERTQNFNFPLHSQSQISHESVSLCNKYSTA